jgi:hypothetical protein
MPTLALDRSMSTSNATETGGASDSAAEVEPPEEPSVVRTVGVPWLVALVFAGMTYLGVTNTDVSPTLLGELIFGFMALVLFLVGLYGLVSD